MLVVIFIIMLSDYNKSHHYKVIFVLYNYIKILLGFKSYLIAIVDAMLFPHPSWSIDHALIGIQLLLL